MTDLPMEPLSRLVDSRGGMRNLLHAADVDPATYARLYRAWFRAKKRGRVRWQTADVLCIVLLREHPILVWGDAWINRSAAEDLPEPAAR